MTASRLLQVTILERRNDIRRRGDALGLAVSMAASC
jgi:hypothetical protein